MPDSRALEDREKNIYLRCFEALKNGGWFFNIDEIKTIYKEAYINSLHY